MIFFPSHQPMTIPKMYAKEYHLITINPKFIKTLGTPYFFIKYGIDSLQLAKSEEYYTKNPRKYQKIYMRVLLRMEKHKDSFNLLSKTSKLSSSIVHRSLLKS